MINEIELLMAIERLVLNVSRTLDNELRTKCHDEQKLRSYTRQFCDLIPEFSKLPKNLQFALSARRFYGAMLVVERLYYWYGIPSQEIPYLDQYIEICRALYISQQEFDRDRNRFYDQEHSNRLKLKEYLNSVIQKHNKTLWVRVELKYYKECLDDLSIANVDWHLKILRKRISDQDTCFKDLVGYAWALEQGGETGAYHVHLLLIYNGSLRRGDWKLADEVCKLWEKITDGHGIGFNLHHSKLRDYYQACGMDGLGMVKRNDLKKVENAIRLGLYLTQPEKYEQRLRAKVFGMRTFGHGNLRFTSSNLIRQPNVADDVELRF